MPAAGWAWHDLRRRPRAMDLRERLRNRDILTYMAFSFAWLQLRNAA
jgi:hypothetical protein